MCLTLTATEDGHSLIHDLEFVISKRQVITMICIPWSNDPVYFEFYHMKWRMCRIHYTLKINSLTFVSVIHTGLYVLALQLLQSGAGMLRRVLESICSRQTLRPPALDSEFGNLPSPPEFNATTVTVQSELLLKSSSKVTTRETEMEPPTHSDELHATESVLGCLLSY